MNVFDLQRKAASGAVALISRQVFTKLVGIVANVLLARILVPEQFGVFAVVTFAVSLLTMFADGGLGASLLRQPTEPTEEERAAVFTAHQILVGVPFLALVLFAPWIAAFYHLDNSACWLIRFMGLSAVITSFRLVPQIWLERRLSFGTLSRIEMLESCSYQIIAVVGALSGEGAWSFGLGAIASQIIATSLTYMASPWKIRWRFDWSLIRSRLVYSLNYQGSGIISFIKDSVNPLFLGLFLGVTSVGYASFALTQAQYPLWAVAILGRLYMPLLAQVQTDTELLRKTIESVVRWNCLLVLGLTSVLLPLIHLIIPLVFGAKWLPVLPLIYPLAVGNLTIGISSPLMSLANAMGRSDIGLRYAIIWMVGTWVLTVPLVLKFGLIGFALAHLLLQITNFMFIADVKKLLNFHVGKSVYPSLIAAVLNGCMLVATVRLTHGAGGLYGMLLLVALGLVGFACFARLVWGRGLWQETLKLVTKPTA